MNVSVILPSLNPNEKLLMVVNGLIKEGFNDIIIVNDGSNEAHMEPFIKAAEYEQVTILTHEVNKGKGRALKTAYEYCLENRKDIAGVVTVDGDNQHLPDDIKACCDTMLSEPELDKVVLGCRDFSRKDVPWKSKVGNNITKAVFRGMCGIKLSDTQTGLRAIPTKYLKFMTEVRGERFEYETQVLLDMKHEKIQFIEVPIATVYEDDNSETHFHPVKDSFKIYRVILKDWGRRLVTFGKFAAGSVLSFLIDQGLFALLGHVLVGVLEDNARIFAATAAARVVSSVFNFIFNRKAVFHSKESTTKTLVRYYLLCVFQMAISAGLVALFTNVFKVSGFWESLVKIVVDICLFLFSFQIQKRWVFANKNKEGE